MSCPECGHTLKTTLQGLSLNVTCSNCDWAVATTNTNHAAFDQTEYTVHLKPSAHGRKDVIISVAMVLNIGAANARELIDRGSPLASNITATDAMRLRNEFSLRNIDVAVTPPLLWKADGTAPEPEISEHE